MPERLDLEYFYGDQSEQFSFYRIPKALFTDKRFKVISAESKILYGMILDRMSLSLKNGWIDSQNRVFIHFTLKEAESMLGCAHDKATKLFNELDNGIGLIERIRRGQGKPIRIYIKNFASGLDYLAKQPTPSSPVKIQTAEKPHSENKHQKSLVQNAEKPQSGLRKTSTLDCAKSASSNTYKSKTDFSDIDSSSSASEKDDDYLEKLKSDINYSDMEDDMPSAQMGIIDSIIGVIVDLKNENIPQRRLLEKIDDLFIVELLDEINSKAFDHVRSFRAYMRKRIPDKLIETAKEAAEIASGRFFT